MAELRLTDSLKSVLGEIKDSNNPKVAEGPNTEVVKIPQGTVVVAAEPITDVDTSAADTLREVLNRLWKSIGLS